jgi:cysteine desulfurase family protein (TIGR01976 family)
MYNAQEVRRHFPALQPRPGEGPAPVFFDNPAGTQIAKESLKRINDYLVRCNANHGGAFRASRESDEMLRQARAAVGDFLGAGRPEEVSFGQNMTSLTLHVSRSLARELNPGDEIVVTRLDHDANISPWLLIARDRGCTVRWVDFDLTECRWSIEQLQEQVNSRTRIVAVGMASNATGTINPVAAAARIAHQAGALCFVDAVHFAPHGTIDVQEIGCDLLACSAYKFFGPHTGVLWGRFELMERLSPYKVRPAGDAPPEKWETGTQSFESIAGVIGAIEYLQWVGKTFGTPANGSSRAQVLKAAMSAVRAYEQGISTAMRDGLSSIKGLRIFGITAEDSMKDRVPTYAFTLPGWQPRKICEALDAQGISAWDGNYYAPEVTRRLGLEDKGGMVRVGAAHYTTAAEVERLVGAVARLCP